MQTTMQEGFVNSAGVRIHYVTQGKGPLMVMIHGFPDYCDTWRYQAPALARHFQVVAIDQRGYNLSDQPKRVEDYTADKLVGDVLAVIRHFGQERAVLIGHDWGGFVAWLAAMTCPEAVDRLVVLNLPHPRCFVREWRHNPLQRQASEYAREFLREDAAQRLDIEQLAWWVQEPEDRARHLEALRRSSREGMLNFYKANFPREGSAEDPPMPLVKCPVLLLHGLDDPYILPGALNDTWKQVERDLTLITIPGAGHWVHRDAADFVTQSMMHWLTGARKEPGPVSKRAPTIQFLKT